MGYDMSTVQSDEYFRLNAEAALDRGDWVKAKRYIDSASLLHKRIY